MEKGVLGKEYADGEVICRQGEAGNCMYVVQSGSVTIIRESGGKEIVLSRLKAGDIFGEMAIFDRAPRSATARADGSALVLTLDKRAFLRRVHEDPSLAFNILRTMSERIRHMDSEIADRKGGPAG